MGKRKSKKNVAYQCEICGTTQKKPVVACDSCDKWHHFDCVGVKSIGKNDTWLCNKCKPPSVRSSSIAQQSSTTPSVCSLPKTQQQHQPSTTRTEPTTRPSQKALHRNQKFASQSEHRNVDYELRYDIDHPYYRENQPMTTAISVASSREAGRHKTFLISSRSSNVNRNATHRQRIELDIIKEERILREIRDSQYLGRKLQILSNDRERQRQESSSASYVNRDSETNRTEKWIRSLQMNKSMRFQSEKDDSVLFNVDRFTERLNNLRFDNVSSTTQHQHLPSKGEHQTKHQHDDKFLRCGICHMIAVDENFGACLLCSKNCHFACLEIIMIDDDAQYVCPSCKASGRLPHRQFSTPLHKFSAKQPPYITSEQQDRNLVHCDTCGKTNEQQTVKACDVCYQPNHFSCMTLASINNEIVWICSTCKSVEVKLSKEETIPNRKASTVLADNQPIVSTTVARPTADSQPIVSATVATQTAESQTIVSATVVAPTISAIAVTPNSSTGASQTLTSAQIASRHVVTKDLPIFVGKPEQWPMFLSRFENSTKLCGFSDSENLDRLQKCLKGNALEAVHSRLLTAESVPEIMSTLEMLYGRPELIVNALMKKIRNEPPPKADKLNTLVDFALSVKNVCATLEQANLIHHLSNPALVQELVDKLPTNFKVDWAKHKATIRDVSLSTLAHFLYDLAKVISTVTEPTITKESKDENKPKKDSNKKDSSQTDSAHIYAHQSQFNKRETTAMQFASKRKADSDSNSIQCIICKKKCEKIENCPVFLSYNVERRWKEMYNHKLCRKCLEKHGRFCTQAKVCGVNGCIFKHHSLLHDEKKHSADAIAQNQLATVTRNNNFHHLSSGIVLLRIVPVTLYSKNRRIETFAYQDDGSDISMVEESVIECLGIQGQVEPLCLLWTGDVHRKENKSKRVEVEISGRNDFAERYTVRNVRTVETLGLPIQTVVREKLMKKFSYLKDATFDDYHNAVPRILIGSDNANLNVPLEIVEGNFHQPIACKSRIGWSLHGRTDFRTSKQSEQMVNIHRAKCPCQHAIDEEIHQLVKEHFSVENFGVQFNKNLQFCSKEDERALDLLKKHTRLIGHRYETALLWKYDDIHLPDSYGMAYKRLQCLEKHKPETVEAIDKTIQDYIRKGYASKLTDEAIRNPQSARIWYLPIFTVFYPKKPDKIRVVFDGAAKVNGVSLNSVLLKGPDQYPSLVDILRRVREKQVAATGDITEMFPQIKIRREDIHVQRFLWRNGDQSKEPDQYVLERMTFGANCSPASAQFVKNKNAYEFEKEYPRAVEAIVKNHYVDDMLDCQDTDAEMIQLIKDVKKIHSHGGFEIRKFLSNSIAVMKEFSEKDVDLQSNNLDMSFGTERVLGMWWNTKTDCFTFSLKFTKIDQEIVNRTRMPTKRELLKILMSIFDPLGLLSHYLIHLKIILQDVWRSNLGWDDEISSDDIRVAWNDWFDLLPNVENVEIPRLYSPKMSPIAPKSIELHVFVDASEKAFSATAYLRIEDDDGIDCTLVGSKTRVAPLKYLSVPRKELQAAILGSRLLTSIGKAQNLKIDHRQIWSDSSTVLSWLQSDNRKYHQFVAHRVGEILESTNLNEWRWVPSKQNVADEATKWSRPPGFEGSCRWFSGPEFLKLSKDEWPCKVQVEPDTLEEMKVYCAHSHLIVPTLIETENFSNWNKMHRAMAYVGRFVSILRAKVRNEIVPHGPLTRDELVTSEIRLFRQAQFQDFTEEMVLLKRNQNLPADKQKYVRQSSPLYKCTPFLGDDGLIRLHGRIDSANDVAYSTKRPIILPRNNRITRLLVAYYHKMYHHRNHRTVFNEIRQRYFIPSLRVVLNSVRNECQKCKNKRAKAQPPQMADLPPARLAIGFRAFTYLGIDYFGPMHVVIGRRNEKRWGVLFTCLTTRAVHIEIAYHLDTQSCIMCIRNCINLRGCPAEIFSDQGTNMKGMDNTLKALVSELDQDLMASEFTSCYTKWNFNPPASPHMGGAWESMVKLTKSCLYEILPTRHPTEDMLRNLLLEVCNIVNSRPLTYVPLEHEDDEILTPNHFILGTSNGLKPFIEVDIDRPILRSKWMENQRLTDIFWTKFVKEFLPDLTRRTKWHEPVKPIQVGDIVLLIDGTNVRGQYPRARVIETLSGSNDQVRRARIELFSHRGTKLKRSVYWRPVTSLAKLDVHPTKNSLSVPPRDRQTEGSVVNDSSGHHSATPDNANQKSEQLSISISENSEHGDWSL